MFNRNFKPLLLKKHLVSFFIIITFLISFGIFLNGNFFVNQQTSTNNLSKSDYSKLLNSLDTSTTGKSNSGLLSNSNLNKNVIFSYSSTAEKEAILSYIVNHGILIASLQKLPFILAKLSQDQYDTLRNYHINIYLDKLFQAFPQSFLKDSSAVQSSSSYVLPVNQISGTSLINQGYKGQNIKIAVIDTGIDSTHPDLSSRVIYNTSFVSKDLGYDVNEDSSDGNGHGTHVAALAAGTGSASQGDYIGVAPEASLLNLKVGSSLGQATSSAILLAIDDAIKKQVNIITMSLGFDGSYPDDPVSLALDDAVNIYGIVATVSAGNSGPGLSTIATPGAARSVITVGAAYWNNSATFFSSRGPNTDYRYDPDILAPGWYEISALASQSLTEYSSQYYSPSGIISGTNGNYIAESGTSMAAPITAGSVALLLSKYPNLTPQALRATLMSTATNTGQAEYVQGAGFLNLEKADTYLSTHYSQDSKVIDVVSLLPQRSIFPNNPNVFPGDQLKVDLQFVAGNQNQISLSFDNNTLKDLISYDHTVTSLTHEPSGGYYGELLLNFSVPTNPVAGMYNGTLTVTVGSHVYNLVIGPIDITIPTKQVAWNVWYNVDSSDTPTGNYASLSNYLEENESIHLSVVDKPVDSSWIYQYNAIIFPDNELSISHDGINLLKDYINKGGKVVLISSYYPLSEITNYNELSSSYGITLTNVTDMSVTDLGINQEIRPIQENVNLSNFDSVQFSSEISNFTWYGGTPLEVSGQSSIIGSLKDGTAVIAGFKGNSQSLGQLFVFGSEYWFYNDFYGPSEISFSKLFFNYLVNESQPFINIVNNDNEISLNQIWNATVFVGSNSFDFVNNSVISLTEPNGSIITPLVNQPVDLQGGAISFQPTQIGTYTLSVNYNGIVRNTSFLVYQDTVEYNLTIKDETKSRFAPSYLFDSGIIGADQGSVVTLSFDTNKSLSGYSFSVVITLVPELFQQFTGYIQPINSLFSAELALTGSGLHYQADIQTNNSMNVGFYVVELLISKGNERFVGIPYGEFFIAAPDPIIESSTSTIDGNTLSQYDLAASSNFQVLSLSPGQVVSMSIKASSLQGNGSAFVLFVPFYPFLESQVVIKYWQLNQTAENLFEGNITIPTATSMTNSNNLTLNYGNGYITSLIIILRDSQGNVDYVTVITKDISNQFPIDDNMLLFFFVILPGLIVMIYYFRTRGRRNDTRYNNYNFNNNNRLGPQRQNPYQRSPPPPFQPQRPSEPPQQIQFCPFCGSKLVEGTNFCDSCGKKLR